MDRKIKTLEKAIITVQKKITQQIPVFRNAPLAQEVTVGTGETMLRQNPEVSEFRALVRDYSQLLKAYKELTADSDNKSNVQALEDIRSKFKVAK